MPNQKHVSNCTSYFIGCSFSHPSSASNKVIVCADEISSLVSFTLAHSLSVKKVEDIYHLQLLPFEHSFSKHDSAFILFVELCCKNMLTNEQQHRIKKNWATDLSLLRPTKDTTMNNSHCIWSSILHWVWGLLNFSFKVRGNLFQFRWLGGVLWWSSVENALKDLVLRFMQCGYGQMYRYLKNVRQYSATFLC